ncbi:MAG: hypothetical protein ACLR2G_01185 [Phascolarctobacterium faecium]
MTKYKKNGKNWVCWEEWGLLRRQSSCGSWRQSVRRQQIRSTLWYI